jgi:hypothetical protein
MAGSLLRFAMGGVLVAKTAVLFNFHAVGVVLFFLGGVVVALFAVNTRQCDFCPHTQSLSLYQR